jgi:hypothetical protein
MDMVVIIVHQDMVVIHIFIIVGTETIVARMDLIMVMAFMGMAAIREGR